MYSVQEYIRESESLYLTKPSTPKSFPHLQRYSIRSISSYTLSWPNLPHTIMSCVSIEPYGIFTALLPSKYTTLRGRVVASVRCQHPCCRGLVPFRQKRYECSGSV